MPTLTQGAAAGAPACPRPSAAVAQLMEDSVTRIRSHAAKLETARAELADAVDHNAPDERIMGLQLAHDTIERTLAGLRKHHAALEREYGAARTAEARQALLDALAAAATDASAARGDEAAALGRIHAALEREVPAVVAARERKAAARRAFRDALRAQLPELFRPRASVEETQAAMAALDAILAELMSRKVPLAEVREFDGVFWVSGLDQNRRDEAIGRLEDAVWPAVRIAAAVLAGLPGPGVIGSGRVTP